MATRTKRNAFDEWFAKGMGRFPLEAVKRHVLYSKVTKAKELVKRAEEEEKLYSLYSYCRDAWEAGFLAGQSYERERPDK